MYAVIETGGKQYKVTHNEELKIEKLSAEIGDLVEFPVLCCFSDESSLKVGAPYLPNITVKASVISQGRREKVKIIKYRRRKHHQKQMGHRQYYTSVKITAIEENHVNGT